MARADFCACGAWLSCCARAAESACGEYVGVFFTGATIISNATTGFNSVFCACAGILKVRIRAIEIYRYVCIKMVPQIVIIKT